MSDHSDSSVSAFSVSQTGSHHLSEKYKCHHCSRNYKALDSLSKHVRRQHANESRAPFMARGFLICPGCTGIFKDLSHHNRHCPGMGGILGYGLNPTPAEVEAVPLQVAEEQFPREEAIRLVVESGTIGLYRTEPAWRALLRQICFSLIPDFTSPQVGFLAQAAFLVLPGLLQKMRMRKKDDKPVDWLRKAQLAASKAHFILSQQMTIFIGGTRKLSSPDIDRSPGIPI